MEALRSSWILDTYFDTTADRYIFFFPEGLDAKYGNACMLSRFSYVRLFATPWTMPGSSLHGILHARILDWIAVPFSRGSSQPREGTPVSKVWESLKYGNKRY